jgi:hypothetical protein
MPSTARIGTPGRIRRSSTFASRRRRTGLGSDSVAALVYLGRLTSLAWIALTALAIHLGPARRWTLAALADTDGGRERRSIRPIR